MVGRRDSGAVKTVFTSTKWIAVVDIASDAVGVSKKDDGIKHFVVGFANRDIL